MRSLIQGTAPINAKGEESYGQFTKHQVNLSPTKERELKKKKRRLLIWSNTKSNCWLSVRVVFVQLQQWPVVQKELSGYVDRNLWEKYYVCIKMKFQY